MKRGKRQIVQKPNMFGSDDQPHSPAQQSSNFLSSFGSATQNVLQSYTTPIVEQPGSRSPAVEASSNKSVEVAMGQTSEAGRSEENDKKKRLEMLKQKYLKNSNKGASIEPQPSKSQSKPVAIEKIIDRKESSQQENQNNSFLDSFSHKPIKQQQRSIPQSEPRTRLANLHNEDSNIPISKPSISNSRTQHSHISGTPVSQKPIKQPQTDPKVQPSQQQTEQKPVVMPPKRKVAPPPAPSRIKSVPPPVAIRDGPAAEDTQRKSIQQQHRAIKTEKQQSIIENSTNNKTHNTRADLNTEIAQWLSPSRPAILNHQQYNQMQITDQIFSLLAPGVTDPRASSLLKGMIANFIVGNTHEYSEAQARFVQGLVGMYGWQEYIVRLFLAIKVGASSLDLMEGELSILENLQQISKYKGYLTLTEQSNFIRFILSNLAPTQETLPYLIAFSPGCAEIYQHFLHKKIENAQHIITVLQIMKTHLQQNMCAYYFKLISSLLPYVNDEKTLLEIIKQTTSINYNSCYQIKKDLKLRVIERIDQVNKGQEAPNMARTNSKTESEKQQEKSSGMNNLMGYFNQAIKKIKSQIPEIPQVQSKPVAEEPQETIVWDPVTKRYMINGKIPEDESGQVQQPDNEDAPKKKVPPPPKLPTKKLPPPTNMPLPKIEAQPAGNEGENTNEEVSGLQQAEQDQDSTRPAVPRVGYKGALPKKPRISGRYA